MSSFIYILYGIIDIIEVANQKCQIVQTLRELALYEDCRWNDLITSQQALERLREGNQRFVANQLVYDSQAREMRRQAAKDGQAPFAIILGCSDSRVPAEIIFDQGLGDLFVIRVAGNIVAPSQIGSVEFAVENFATPLVVVMGHSGCGAVEATINELKNSSETSSGNLNSIIDRISPAIAPLMSSFTGDELMAAAVRANIHEATESLRQGSASLQQKTAEGELLIVGAEYSLEHGASRWPVIS